MTSEKMYRIGEVAQMLNLKTHVLRFWETEFPQIDPLRTEKGQRLYTESHISILRKIQQLLHEQGMTIEGARRVLEGGNPVDEVLLERPLAAEDQLFMQTIKNELVDICKILSSAVPR